MLTKYRIYRRVNEIRTRLGSIKHYTEVFEIQRRGWFRWVYVEAWSTREHAEWRLRDLTGPDRPRSWFERFVARTAEVAAAATRLVFRLQ